MSSGIPGSRAPLAKTTQSLAKSTLYVVATPIGNLGDITARALEVLRAVDWIAAEDTRHTRRLLSHFGIRTRLLSAHAHNEAERAADLVTRLARGESGALVVDAGSPGISDPGARIVATVAGAGLGVTSVPGPSALVAALQVSGLDTRAFTFVGFLPTRSGPRRARLERLLAREETLVLYEAPHRIRTTLGLLAELAPDRAVAACRELTKKFEEVRRGSALEILAGLDAAHERGEWVVVVAGSPLESDATTATLRTTAATARARTAAERAAVSDRNAGALSDRDAGALSDRDAAAGSARERFIAAQLEGGASPEEARRRADFVLGRSASGNRRRSGRGSRS